MDPVGPWSAYAASYNRAAGAQQPGASGDIHSQLTQSGTPPTTSAQILPGGFISQPPVGYETVFSPLFHHAGTKLPVHYVTQAAQPRQPSTQTQSGAVSAKQPTEGEYQGQAYYEQGGVGWQQHSPFGVLPHESIVPATTASKSTVYENFNPQFAAAQSLNHMSTQVAPSNSKSEAPRVQTTQSAKSSSSQPNSGPFFQVLATFPDTNSPPNTKTFASSDASTLQQTCIATSASNIPHGPNHTAFLASDRRLEKPFSTLPDKQLPQIQTKAQTKIYPDLNNPADRQRSGHQDDNPAQSSPGSFAMDGSPCLNYTNSAAKRAQFQSSNYRHYQPGNNTETEFQRAKTGLEYNNSNGSDCRRASPLQTASPLGHAQSPAYPMYNSPMSSVPSPQTPNNQVATSSPLDVTVSRSNTQSGNIAYPSVITRALNSDKKFPDHYDRPVQQQQTQDCWDERQAHHQQQRKFQTHSTVPTNYAAVNNLEMQARIGDQCQQRNVSAQERQQAYLNTSGPRQIPLQDLVSCRGDPISLVKNMQQQGCHVQQLDVKVEPKTPNKRRKSNDKLQQLPSEVPQGATMPEYFTGRIPPPAHSSVANQQQNGAYFDFDRWNLPAPSSKMFGTQTIHQQHQGIMVPHPHSHHPPPPLPYFPPFHLASHPEYPPTVELTPVYNDHPIQQTPTVRISEEPDQPKVVVPNIEEELEFLSGETSTRTSTSLESTPAVRPQTIVNQASSSDRTGGTAGFMNSYLKFLQGDRDTSPPPPSRGNRKQSWSRSKPTQPTVAQTNGMPVTPIPPPPIPAARLSQGDPQDDPRYFPLPKERKKNRFDSSDDGFSSDDDLFTKKGSLLKSDFSQEKIFKRANMKPIVSSVNRKPPPRKHVRPKKEKFHDDKVFSSPLSATTEVLPRRESSRRAAKEKSSLRKIILGEDDMDHIDYIDSDSDPAWSPKRNEDDDIAAVMRKGRRIKNGGKRRPPRNLITAAAQCAGINDLDGYISDGTGSVKKSPIMGTNQPQKSNVALTLEDNIAAAVAQQPSFVPNATENPFKSGEFLVVKSDLLQKWPPIWRVEGKASMQKYEPFEQNDQMLYKSIQTFTAWTPESIKQYVSVSVNYVVQNPTKIVVELVRNEMIDFDITVMEKSMDANKAHQDNFEVYIQTLISQALDSNFLTEIFQEQDEYFLSNVKTIDDITENQKNKMIQILQWPKAVLVAIDAWPCFNLVKEVNASSTLAKPCAACQQLGVSVRILMYGQPYNASTLEGCQVDSYAVGKDFYMCRTCGNRVELINKISHQKYLMYIQCAKKVAEKRVADPNKDTTCILNELLADEPWLNKLFDDVRYTWAEVDNLVHKHKLIDQCSDSSNNKIVL